MRARFCLLRIVVAAFLAVLVALPFTAPFKTWDLSAPVGDMPMGEPSPGEKVIKDAVVVSPAFRLVRIEGVVSHAIDLSRRTVSLPRLLSTVLRL